MPPFRVVCSSLDTVDIHQKKIADLTSLIVENEAFWESMKKDDKNIDKKD